jgi:ubiquinone/menaquinone biosynthesis C-methylase UbiE
MHDRSATVSSKGYKGVGMNGFIARQYDKSARRDMAELYRTWAAKLAEGVKDGSNVLEIAPGPGYLAIELAKRRNLKIVGLDVSETFVAIARKNAHDAGVHIDFQHGNASAMPFENEKFDFLMCTSSFKNFSEPLKALNEMYRVLKPGGKAWISDLRHDVSDETINSFVRDTMKLSGLNGIFMKYTFKHTLRPRALTGAQFKELIAKTPFSKVDIKENAIDLEVLLGK